MAKYPGQRDKLIYCKTGGEHYRPRAGCLCSMSNGGIFRGGSAGVAERAGVARESSRTLGTEEEGRCR